MMAAPRRRFLVYACLVCVLIHGFTASAWEWSDLIVGGRRGQQQSSSSSRRRSKMATASASTNAAPEPEAAPFLTLNEVSEMRVRDIKWRLARHHGYSAEELGKMIDKKDLIQALAYAEEQSRILNEAAAKRSFIVQGLCFSFVAMVTVCLWPLIAQAWEVATVNLIVYKDKKVYEAQRCMELKSPAAVLGVVLMGILDVLQVWLSLSVFLSWFIRSKYFFPTPNLSVRPAQFLGQEIANSAAGSYGINLGSMVITWAMRFAHGKIELWTGRAMAVAHRQKVDADKAHRKEAKQKAKEEAEQAKKAARESHQKEFLDHLDHHETQFDSLD